MLPNIKKATGAACLAATLCIGATAAQAETHTVVIFEFGFFPEVTYVKPGDTVVFENASGIDQGVQARNESWSVPTLSDGESAQIAIVPDMQATFLTSDEGMGFEGNFNYDDPPLN